MWSDVDDDNDTLCNRSGRLARSGYIIGHLANQDLIFSPTSPTSTLFPLRVNKPNLFWNQAICTGCPKKIISRTLLELKKPKFSTDMTWQRLILLSFRNKRQKNNFQRRGCPSWVEITIRNGCQLLMMKQVHHASSSILWETFFEIHCMVALSMDALSSPEL